MVQLNLNLCTVGFILLAFAAPSLGTSYQHKQLIARQNDQIGATKGGRKVGIVIDESNSMKTNDPTDIRITAGKALDESLISQTEATDGKTADAVTIVGFHSSPNLLYPLGDPSGAIPVIDNITSTKSGTFIGGGIGAATDELTKPGTGTTANRTGIVVLTDGEDNYSGLTGVQGTINEIARAGELGIRVSFGFLSIGATSQDPEILTEIIKTGGTFTTFDNAASQENFIAQVLLQGLTGMDATSNSTSLLPGLTTSAVLAQDGNAFSYYAKSGETLNFTITAIDNLSLEASLRDAVSGTGLASNQTNSTGVAVIQHTAAADVSVELLVKTSGTYRSGIFSVGVQSSLGLGAGRAPPKSAGIRAVSVSGTTVSLVGFLFSALLLWI